MTTTPLETGLRLRAVKRNAGLAPHAERSSFDPSRFGTLHIPRDLRRELIATKLPEIPADRLYVSPTAAPVALPHARLARLGRAAPRLLVLGSAVVALLVAFARFWSLK